MKSTKESKSQLPPATPPVAVPVPTEQRAYAVTPPANMGLLAHYSALPSTEMAGIMTTLDLTNTCNIVILQNVLAGASESLWDLPPDRIIEVTDLIAHYAERLDEETGEMHAGPMLTLIGPGGVWHTGSQFAFRDIQRAAMLWGPPPWNPPLRVRAVRTRSRNKRDFQSVILVA